MAPELPYLAAGAVAIVGGVRREGQFPANGIRAIIATAVLVIVSSALATTKVAPLVRAIGFVVLLGAVFGTTRAYQKKEGK